jgi:hypothetical protein
MKTKTLLIAAAALAAGVMSSQAQVYSQNIVGYVNINLTNGVLTSAATPLDLDGTGTNNTVTTAIGTNLPSGTVIYVFNGSGYDTLTFAPATKGGTPVWSNPVYPLNPGDGYFILPSATTTLTYTGDVLQGVLTNVYVPAAGSIWLVASQAPLAGGVETTLGYPANSGDVIYIYDAGTSAYNTYTFAPASKGGTPVWSPSEPQIAVGQSFWLQTAQTTVWTNVFNP